MKTTSLRVVARRLCGKRGTLFVLSSPSGGGKTTVVRQLLRRIPKLARSISVTTRDRRRGERSGRDYIFVSQAMFRRWKQRKAFLESACVHTHYYGTPRQRVERLLARGYDVIVTIDVQGAAMIRHRDASSISIFLMPPSWTTLAQRLQRRGTDDPRTVAQRLRVARHEVREARHYDFIVVNNRLVQTVHDVSSIIYAERHRTQGSAER
jgi:guanylate kinase